MLVLLCSQNLINVYSKRLTIKCTVLSSCLNAYDTLYDIGAVYLSETLMREDLARKGPDVPDVVRPDIPMRASTAVACLTRLDVQSGSGRAGPVVPRKNNVNFAKISDCITLLRMKHFAIP